MTNQIQKTCALSSCDKPFEGKSSKKFCSDSCRRRGHHDKKLTLAKTSNQPKEYSHANARRSEEIFDSSYGLTHMFYNHDSDQQKLDLCLELLSQAADSIGNIRMVLTAPYLIKPDLRKSILFYHGDVSNTKTISEIVNSLCYHMFNKGTMQVLREKNFTPYFLCDFKNIPISTLARRQHNAKKYKKCNYGPKILTSSEIDVVMKKRPEWVKDMRKSIQSPVVTESKKVMAA